MAEKSSHSWEELRKRARQLENEIDSKLVSFSKYGTSYHSSAAARDRTPLLSDTEHQFDELVADIDSRLTKLSAVNDKMQELTTAMGSMAGSAMLHTRQRHKDILQDYTIEFRKTKSNIESYRQRDDLMSSVKKDFDYKTGLNRRSDLYLKENEHLRSSDRLVDEQIHIAASTRDNLIGQRTSLKHISKRLNDLGNRFPIVNSLMQKVNFRKRRDTIILGAVISGCVLFLLIWFIH